MAQPEVVVEDRAEVQVLVGDLAGALRVLLRVDAQVHNPLLELQDLRHDEAAVAAADRAEVALLHRAQAYGIAPREAR